jgi:NADPH2:quinone reductase
MATRPKALTGGRGLDIVVDPVGGGATEPAFRSLAYRGRHLPVAEAAAREKILELFAAGVLSPPIGRVYPLKDYVAAMEAAKSGNILGRVLLR